MGSFGARDAIFPLTLRLEFIEPSTTIVHEPPLATRSSSAETCCERMTDPELKPPHLAPQRPVR